MHPDQLRSTIQTALPDAEVYCYDLTGTQDHWQIEVVSARFEGKRLLEQHRIVKDALADPLKDRTIHALSLKTYTPEQWSARPTGGTTP